jgi:hypothetical protein
MELEKQIKLENHSKNYNDKVSNKLKNKNNNIIDYLLVVKSVLFNYWKIVVSSLLIYLPYIIFKNEQLNMNVNNNQLEIYNNNCFGNMHKNIIAFNIFTFVLFSLVYFVEIIREFILIKLFDVDINESHNGDSVKKLIDKLPSSPINWKILLNTINLFQKYSSYLLNAVFLINIIISGISTSNTTTMKCGFFSPNKTILEFIVCVTFGLSKLKHSFDIARTQENVFYSAFIKEYVQYNVLDENYIPNGK